MDRFVLTEHRAGGVCIVTLNRPHKANAYDASLLRALRASLDDLADARVVVITGAGRHFCAGADLAHLAERRLLDALNLESARLFDHIAQLNRPTIAAIHGAALGGGLELALACDVRVATEDAILGLPETSFGLIPAAGGTLRLPRLIGVARAKEMIFTARRVPAPEALTLGLINQVTDLEGALALARNMARHDPLALELAKRAIDMHEGPGGYPAAAQALLYHRRSNDHA